MLRLRTRSEGKSKKVKGKRKRVVRSTPPLGWMNTRIATSIVFLLAVSACTRVATNTHVGTASRQVAMAPTTPIDLTGSTADEWQRHLGETVIMHGTFSLFGKTAPYITVRNEPIYIKPQGSFSWGNEYARLERREVRVTGTLRFVHHDQTPQGDVTQQREYDHYYFDAETSKIELDR